MGRPRSASCLIEKVPGRSARAPDWKLADDTVAHAAAFEDVEFFVELPRR